MRTTATKPAKKPDNEWQVQTAKARFSELFRRVRTEGPQRVTRQGKEAVVVITAEEYDKLTSPSGRKSLWEVLRESPLVGLEMDFKRNKSLSRDIKL
jgi:prevent-host-death family protein